MSGEEVHNEKKSRPFLLSLLCVAIYVYAATMSLLLLFVLIFHQWIRGVVADYFGLSAISTKDIVLIAGVGLLIHIALFIAGLLIWKLKRVGYYILVASFLLLGILPIIFGYGNWFGGIVYIIIIMFFSFFYPRYS